MASRFSLERIVFIGLLLLLMASAVRSQSALFPVRDGNRIGYVDQTGSLAIPVAYAEAQPFSEGRAAVKIDRKWGYIDGGGALVSLATYFSAAEFAEGLAAVCTEYIRCGYIDRMGTWVIPPEFWVVGQFTEGVAAAQTGEGFGYIDHSGKWVVPPRKLVSRDRSEGCLGRPMLSLDAQLRGGAHAHQFDDADQVTSMRFSQGRAAISLDGETWGVIDREGNWVVEPGYQWIGVFGDGLAPFFRDDKIGFIDRAGLVVIPAQFDDTRGFVDGVAAVVKNDRWGFIDTKGRFVIAPQFDGADSFSEGSAPVEIDGRWGLISREGKVVLSPSSEYRYIGQVTNGLAKAYLSDGNDGTYFALIDAEGRVVWRETQ